MKLDRRTFVLGGVGFATGGAMTALFLQRNDKLQRHPESTAQELTANHDERDLPSSDLDLSRLQRTTAHYFLHETNPDNGLVRDKTDPAAPCSIAAVGLALATLPVVIHAACSSGPTRQNWRGESCSSYPGCLKAPRRMPPGTKAFSTISSTWRPAVGSGSASYQRSIRRSCSPGC